MSTRSRTPLIAIVVLFSLLSTLLLSNTSFFLGLQRPGPRSPKGRVGDTQTTASRQSRTTPRWVRNESFTFLVRSRQICTVLVRNESRLEPFIVKSKREN
nr:uncharacterized protein LOC123748764 isoform X2 [Procambarus clarkii]